MKRPTLVAISLVAVVCLWVALGMAWNAHKNKSQTPAATAAAAEASDTASAAAIGTGTVRNEEVTVTVINSKAKQAPRSLSYQGQLQPNRSVVLKAETTSSVVSVYQPQGAQVVAGQPIVRLSVDNRASNLSLAQAKLADAQRIYQSSLNLYKQDYISKNKLQEAELGVKQAEASFAEINKDVARTTVDAPFDGILTDQKVHEGDYVNPSQPLITIVDNTPLLAVINVPQQAIANIKLGQTMQVTLPNGTQMQGKVRYVAPQADSQTRSFTTEIELANPTGLPAGGSVQVALAQGFQTAHLLSPAAITLNPAGKTSVKTLNAQGVVESTVVNIIQAAASGVWVTGLPATATVIVFGGDYTKVGGKPKFKLAAPTTSTQP